MFIEIVRQINQETLETEHFYLQVSDNGEVFLADEDGLVFKSKDLKTYSSYDSAYLAAEILSYDLDADILEGD